MSLTATVTGKITVNEDLATNAGLLTDKTVTSQINVQSTINGTSNPAGTVHAAFQQALTAGAATIDLTNLSGVNGKATDGTGLRVQAAIFRNPAANANPITISKGAANAYDGFGVNFSITLAPGASVGPIVTADAGSDIGPAKKNLDLAGTGAQALDVIFVLG